MTLEHLHLIDFRAFEVGEFSPVPEGTTVLVGPNGTGKTTVLEALAYLGTGRSLRGSPREAMVRTGCGRAVARAELRHGERPVLVEAEVVVEGRSRAQVNRQPVRSLRQLADAVPVTIFTPDDLGIIQGGPGRRRDLLDDALALLDPAAGSALDQLDRILRQRAALLRQAAGRLTPDVEASLDIWDQRLATAGEAVAEARRDLVEALAAPADQAYAALGAARSAAPDRLGLRYQASWTGDLATALATARREDLRRGVTTRGPHRDDVAVSVAGRDAREQASQGEQRSVALALRLAVHHLVTARRGRPPVLLLDDVFSELDPERARALVELLPAGQALLTTAVPLPEGMAVAATVDIAAVHRPARKHPDGADDRGAA